MRFFKTDEPAQSEEDRAAALRLAAIAKRYRAERPSDAAAEAIPEPLNVTEVLQ
jgi:hypothetical protein